MPLQATSGAASYDAFGGGVPVVPNYIEEVFSTYLYTGTGVALNINNGIDLSTKGGLVWIKQRSGTGANGLIDTARGRASILYSNTTGAATTDSSSTEDLTSFNSNGFSLGSQFNFVCNSSGQTFTSWTFRKQPKFFDVVTYTGDGTSPRAISHNLGSAPGCVIIKQTNAANDWCVWHTATGNDKSAALNLTDAFATFAQRIKSVTSTTFSVGNSSTVNDSGATYVAYLFAHDAGGFGLTGTDNVISCGSYTGTGAAGNAINLGYETQWVMIKNTTNVTSWQMFDVMRGMPMPTSVNSTRRLMPNKSDAEFGLEPVGLFPTATGFTLNSANGDFNASGDNYIYIAIRRGPMKVPTSGTSVFSPEAFTGDATTRTIGSITTDSLLLRERASDSWDWSSRLTGSDMYLQTNNTLSESSATAGTRPSYTKEQLGVVYNGATKNQSGAAYIDYLFKRAPNFFDEVCYTGTGSGVRLEHNLQVVPELILIKSRSASGGWAGVQLLPDASNGWNQLSLQSTSAGVTVSSQTGSLSSWMRTYDFFNGYVYRSDGTTPTTNNVNFVAYLFATCAGVSKVGSYTGNGSSQTINCGFTGGARFVLIKKSSGTGDWMVSDSARGIVSGNDPYLELNNTNAEVTGEDWLDTDSTGFVVNEVSGSNANTSGATYIFLAIA